MQSCSWSDGRTGHSVKIVADHEQRLVQEPRAPRGDKRRERPGVAGDVLHVGHGEGDRAAAGAGGRQEAEAVQEDHDQGLSGGVVREVQQRGTSLGHGEDRPQRRLKTCMILERQLTMIDGR